MNPIDPKKLITWLAQNEQPYPGDLGLPPALRAGPMIHTTALYEWIEQESGLSTADAGEIYREAKRMGK